jgi:hypothetical protein
MLRKRILTGALVAVLATGLALAITGNVEMKVTDAAGKPISGAKVSLQRGDDAIPGAIVYTDGNGVAVLTADEGPVTVVVENGGDRKETAVTIMGGKTVSKTISMGGAPPADSLIPGARSAGVTVGGRFIADGDLVKAVDRLYFNGALFSETEGDLDALNEDFDHELYAGFATFDLSWQFRRDAPYGKHGRFLPSIQLSVGMLELETEFHNNDFPDFSNTFKDQGPLYGVGFTLVQDCDNPGYVGGQIDYRWATGIEADRDPQVSAPGGTLLQDSADMDYSSGTFRIFYGREFLGNKATWWAGGLYNKTEVSLDGTVRAEFPTGTTEIKFENDIENESAALEAGLRFRFGDSRVVGGVTASANEDDWAWDLSIGLTF